MDLVTCLVVIQPGHYFMEERNSWLVVGILCFKGSLDPLMTTDPLRFMYTSHIMGCDENVFSVACEVALKHKPLEGSDRRDLLCSFVCLMSAWVIPLEPFGWCSH